MSRPSPTRQAVESILTEVGSATIAVSGGVDSLTLATLAGRLSGFSATAVHAVSPAVPAEATERVRKLAAREGWRLSELDAGEFEDRRYLDNPLNRCFYCKHHLYASLATLDAGTILSGTNLDDLGDYRPGLRAAADHGVRHPFVEARVDKSGVRALARELGLEAVSRLPASPCLASRVETGRPIDARELAFIGRIERLLRDRYGLDVVRCRVREARIGIEIGEREIDRVDAGEIGRLVKAEATSDGFTERVEVGPYRRGSAFLQERGAA